LTELDLSWNEICELPISFSQLTNLKRLNLEDNPIKSLPPALSHLNDITTLD
jgi:Leucine-rich repeat (LRR) protein